MKKILRLTLLFSFSLVCTNLLWQNLTFQITPWTYVKTAFILAIFEVILKPILKIILFPINLLTLGLFRAVIDTVGLYLAAFVFSDFYVSNIHSPSNVFFGLTIPPFNFTNFWAFLVTSLTIGFFLNLFTIIIKKPAKK
ncbi:MAG: phage holin family protein [Candidatus Shapirobacteria bacterium]|nr:phage holin family protein [Candidatus Shapirobacteria bacterium]